MGIRATGRIGLISTKKLEGLTEIWINDFVKKNHLNKSDIEDVTRSNNAILRLAAFAGFDIANSSFREEVERGRIVYTLFYDNDWDEIKVPMLIQYLTDKGVGVAGTFNNEEGLTWEYNAEVNIEKLFELANLWNPQYGRSLNKAEMLRRALKLIGKISSDLDIEVSELIHLVEADKFKSRVTLLNP